MTDEKLPQGAPIAFTRHRNSRLAMKPDVLESAASNVSETFRELKSGDREAQDAAGRAKSSGRKGRVELPEGGKRKFTSKRPAKKTLSHTMGVRMTLEERQAIEDAAADRGFDNASQFLRRIALDAVKKGV